MRSSIEVVLGDVFQHADDGQSSEIRAQIDRLTRLVQEARAPRDTTSMDTAFMLGQLWTGFGSGSYVGGFSAPGGRPSVSQATRAAANDDALAMTGSMSPNVNVSEEEVVVVALDCTTAMGRLGKTKTSTPL